MNRWAVNLLAGIQTKRLFRRQSVRPFIEPAVEKELEALGPAELRRLLATTYPPAVGSIEEFLEPAPPLTLRIGHVERDTVVTWLSLFDAAERRQETVRFQILALLAASAAVISTLAWVFPRAPERKVLPPGAIYSDGETSDQHLVAERRLRGREHGIIQI